MSVKLSSLSPVIPVITIRPSNGDILYKHAFIRVSTSKKHNNTTSKRFLYLVTVYTRAQLFISYRDSDIEACRKWPVHALRRVRKSPTIVAKSTLDAHLPGSRPPPTPDRSHKLLLPAAHRPQLTLHWAAARAGPRCPSALPATFNNMEVVLPTYLLGF
jgi:hypothetical protein